MLVYSFDLTYIYHFIDATMSFNQSLYCVEEDKGSAQLTLFLSEPLSTDVIVRVNDSGITATGELTNMMELYGCLSLLKYIVVLFILLCK